MARDALVALLAEVRRGVSLDELQAHIPQLHKELIEIVRKRSHFLEDTCAAVLAQSFGSWTSPSDSEDDGDDVVDVRRTLDAVSVCLDFVEPLVQRLPPREAGEDTDVLRQRAVLVAFVLSILGRSDLFPDCLNAELAHASARLASIVLSSGIALDTIMWTLRFREELHIFRSMLRPSSDMDDDSGNDLSDEDDADDDAWIVHTVAAAAGVDGPLEYFLKESGHEYAFASWSPAGIVRLVGLLVTTSDAAFSPPVSVLSPYSTLFTLGAVANALLQGQTVETKRQGLVVLKYALEKCQPARVVMGSLSSNEPDTTTRSFTDASAAFRSRDWITPLVELVSNAMVSLPEADDRALGLIVFRQLLQVVEIDHRFWLMKRLALRCPYGNVAAVLVDQLRNDTFRVWSSPALAHETRPHTSSELTTAIVDLLTVLVERDLKMHADLLASVASWIRFVAIRDKTNRTGMRAPDAMENVKQSLVRLHSRLRSIMDDVGPSIPTSGPADIQAMLHDENSRLVLVEAALCSTLELLSS